MSDEQAFFTSLDELKNSLDDSQNDEKHVLDLSKKASLKSPDEEQWFAEEYEGQLSVDVYQTKKDIIVKATIAGVQPDDLEIYIHNDLLTIRGKRMEEKEEKDADYFYKECYWGGFSRSIILPVEVVSDNVDASFKNGVLKIVMPKSQKSKLINVKVKEG
jgi:HSP20 family protein